MRLINLRLKNFKGIKAFELHTNGENTTVFGDNATGKTTLFDAFLWLLFDKDSQGRKDFEIKTIGSNGQPIHGLEHEVEAIFDLNGKPITLRKVYAEQWTKKRGSADREFTGHSTDYFINDVPAKKTDYTAKINEIANEDVFKLITSPSYFNTQLHWQERRKILLSICGDIQDEEVIAANPALIRLPDILQGRNIEDHRKVIASKRAEINKELERIPVRISEVENSLPFTPDGAPANIQNDLAKLQRDLAAKQTELSSIENGGGVAEKTKTLRQVEVELFDIQCEFRQGIETQITAKQRQISELRGTVMELTEKAICPQPVTEELEKAIERLRQKWHEINGRYFVIDETCPTCGQTLPAEKLEEAKANFNRQKAEELEQISSEGKTNKATIDRLKSEHESRLTKAEEARAELQKVEAKIIGIQSEIEDLRKATADNIPSYITKSREKAAIETEITNLQNGTSEAAEKVRDETRVINSAIQSLQMAQANLEQRERGIKRIAELKQQERDLAKEYERLEGELFMTEEFIRAKVNLLEERINSRFNIARFKLFETQINGGVTECCETLYKGIPYSGGLNNAARINVGLDIINTLSEHYKFTAPIFVDNAESVTSLLPTAGQVISLIVSVGDKQLRMEPQDKQLKEAV